MRIVCVCADASTNSLVRLHPIAKVLQRRHEVTVAGFRTGPEVFAPYREGLEYRTSRVKSLPAFARQVGQLARSVQADLVYAFKPVSTSLWPGLALRRRLSVPLIVDIEDWELGWYLDRAPSDFLKHLAHVERANGLVWTALNEKLVAAADQRTVVSRFLQRRFGGALVPHGPDTEIFDPRIHDREEALRHLGLPDRQYVVFTGSPMRSKGLEELLLAIERLRRPEVRLLIVGSFDHDPEFRRALQGRFGHLLTLVGPRPHAEMPLYLRVAAVVALPQRPVRETAAQVPGKVYEAMAMGCPILATAMSDLPEILDGCGRVIPPEDQAALEEALVTLLDDPGLRTALGAAARRRCVERYGWDAMERVLDAEIATLTSGNVGRR